MAEVKIASCEKKLIQRIFNRRDAEIAEKKAYLGVVAVPFFLN
jgi:hypothetical protein